MMALKALGAIRVIKVTLAFKATKVIKDLVIKDHKVIKAN
jgi:hypothetical protein